MIRVLAVDDDPAILLYLERYFSATNDIVLAGTAGGGEEALELLKSREFDVVLSDIHMPGMDGIALLERVGNVPFIAMTGMDTNSKLVQTLQRGAVGYVLKTAPPNDVVDSVRSVMSNRAALSQETLARLTQYLPNPAPDTSLNVQLSALSTRDRDILRLLCDGLSNLEIARTLHYSESTVKKRVSELMTLFHATSRLSLVVTALKSQQF